MIRTNPAKSCARALGLLSCVATLSSAAWGTTLYWTGSDGTDNMSVPANWDPAQAPASGDTLVFSGENSPTPYNDLDPASYTFEALHFENNRSSGRTAAFTISGNAIRISSAILGANVASGSLTETFNCDVEFASDATIGGLVSNVGTHHFTFKGAVKGASGKKLATSTQYKGTLRFEGAVSGFASFYRPNGSGNQYFLGTTTAFSGTAGYDLNEGNLYFIDASNFGPAPKFRSGQSSWSTAGTITFTPTNDFTITAKPYVHSPSQANAGLKLSNGTAGRTITFSGDVTEGGTKNNLGTCVVVDGPGNGVFTGRFTKDRMAFTKNGAGTWTFDSAIPSCAMTGLVTVAAGKLVVDTTLPTLRATVAAKATIAGAGTLGTAAGTVSLASGAIYEVGTEGDAARILTMPGTVSLAGPVTVNLTGGLVLAPGSRTTLATAGAWSGSGSFVIGSGFPVGTTFTRGDTALYADVPSDMYTWSGKTSSEWNKTDQNWDGTKVYADGVAVLFPDLADETKRQVSIPSAVSPQAVTVTAAAANPYEFTGAGGLADVSSVTFDGTATNVWRAPLANVGNVSVAAGGLVLTGDVSQTAVRVQPGARLDLAGPFADGIVETFQGASFVQRASSSIGGASTLVLKSVASTLCGTNTFTGALTVGEKVCTGGTNPKSTLYIRAPLALGSGDDWTVSYNSEIQCQENVAVTNRELHLWGYNSYSRVNVAAGKRFEWAGDVFIHEAQQGESFVGDTATFAIGKKDGSSTLRVVDGREFVCVPNALHLHAAFSSSSSLNFRGTLYLYHTNNSWSSFNVNVGTGVMMATNALCATKPVGMLQSYGKNTFSAMLDLNGFDQTISALTANYDPSVQNWATLTSAKPAVLTVSNASASVFNDAATFCVKGALTLRKAGAGTWTLGCRNTSVGDVEVRAGTLAIGAAGSLPTGRDSTLRITDGATVSLGSGVAETVTYAERILASGRVRVSPGLYGGPDCTDAGAVKVTWLAGTGTLRVRRGPAGFAAILR